MAASVTETAAPLPWQRNHPDETRPSARRGFARCADAWLHAPVRSRDRARLDRRARQTPRRRKRCVGRGVGSRACEPGGGGDRRPRLRSRCDGWLRAARRRDFGRERIQPAVVFCARRSVSGATFRWHGCRGQRGARDDRFRAALECRCRGARRTRGREGRHRRDHATGRAGQACRTPRRGHPLGECRAAAGSTSAPAGCRSHRVARHRRCRCRAAPSRTHHRDR